MSTVYNVLIVEIPPNPSHHLIQICDLQSKTNPQKPNLVKPEPKDFYREERKARQELHKKLFFGFSLRLCGKSLCCLFKASTG